MYLLWLTLLWSSLSYGCIYCGCLCCGCLHCGCLYCVATSIRSLQCLPFKYCYALIFLRWKLMLVSSNWSPLNSLRNNLIDGHMTKANSWPAQSSLAQPVHMYTLQMLTSLFTKRQETKDKMIVMRKGKLHLDWWLGRHSTFFFGTDSQDAVGLPTFNWMHSQNGNGNFIESKVLQVKG